MKVKKYLMYSKIYNDMIREFPVCEHTENTCDFHCVDNPFAVSCENCKRTKKYKEALKFLQEKDGWTDDMIEKSAFNKEFSLQPLIDNICVNNESKKDFGSLGSIFLTIYEELKKNNQSSTNDTLKQLLRLKHSIESIITAIIATQTDESVKDESLYGLYLNVACEAITTLKNRGKNNG